jgi:IS605 OrfB family transposase
MSTKVDVNSVNKENISIVRIEDGKEFSDVSYTVASTNNGKGIKIGLPEKLLMGTEYRIKIKNLVSSFDANDVMPTETVINFATAKKYDLIECTAEDSGNNIEVGGKLKLYYGKTIEYNRVISCKVLYQNMKWFILITIRSDNIKPFPKTGKKIGIDLGLKNLIVLSNGQKFDPPNISYSNSKLDGLNQKLSSKKENSRNYNKTKFKQNSEHFHRKNIINDYFHKVSTYIVKEYDVIAMESLDIQDMLKDRRYSKNIFHANWHKLLYMIKYKCELYGKIFIQVSRRFPSTKLCSKCGYKYDDITIDVRTWQCPKCGKIHDRDVNAAKNILNRALLNN